MANRTITYIIWFFFGWTGLHHLYLGRLNQAIVWFATLGGGCGVGWFRDFWRIPDYLEWCNGEKDAQLKYLDKALKNKRPGCSLFRFAGMIVMGFVGSTALGALVPDFSGMPKDPVSYYIFKYAFLALLILGNAIGVYLVANIGELQCSKYYPFLTSLLITPWLLGNNPNMCLPCFLTTFVTWYKGLYWRPVTLQSEKAKSWKWIFLKNVTFYTLACAIWLSVLSSAFYFNATIRMEGGEQIPVREALNNFFKSEAWKKTKDSLYHVFMIYWHDGAGRAWRDASGLFDFTGEVSAFKVLDLPSGASQDMISKRCRKLSAEHHPDRFRIQTEKDKAQEKFIEIQHACSVMSSSHARRVRNMKTPNENDYN